MWDEEFSFLLNEDYHHVQIDLYNKNSSSDELIGTVRFELGEIVKNSLTNNNSSTMRVVAPVKKKERLVGEELQARIQKPVQEKTAEVLGRYGLSQMQLQTAIKQFQEDPKFTAKIKSIEETQAPRIQKVQQLTGGGRPMGLM